VDHGNGPRARSQPVAAADGTGPRADDVHCSMRGALHIACGEVPCPSLAVGSGARTQLEVSVLVLNQIADAGAASRSSREQGSGPQADDNSTLSFDG
jgi:hypothetical protein